MRGKGHSIDEVFLATAAVVAAAADALRPQPLKFCLARPFGSCLPEVAAASEAGQASLLLRSSCYRFGRGVGSKVVILPRRRF